MRSTIVAGNWKMNGTIPETEALIGALLKEESHNERATVLVCPPFTSLQYAAKLLKGTRIGLGAQDVSEHETGAYTSEVSAEMLLTVGVRYVILGHSERRQYHAETDQQVNAKAHMALRSGLTPIICVGESLEQRESGQTEMVVASQIEGALSGFTADLLKRSVVAYEPVWAIGTGKTATPQMAQEAHQHIRSRLAQIDDEAAQAVSILYGGSVKPGNAPDLLRQPDIDGALVGGASLKVDDFVGIINAV